MAATPAWRSRQDAAIIPLLAGFGEERHEEARHSSVVARRVVCVCDPAAGSRRNARRDLPAELKLSFDQRGSVAYGR